MPDPAILGELALESLDGRAEHVAATFEHPEHCGLQLRPYCPELRLEVEEGYGGVGRHHDAARSWVSSTGWPRRRMEVVAPSNVSTTRKPMPPSVSGVVPSRTQAMKCSASVSSASFVVSRGAHMSPIR